MKHLCILLLLTTHKGISQTIKINESKSISAHEIIISNYSPINIKVNVNRFDIHTPYTNLVILTDDRETVGHILYQTDFDDNISFIGISNNLLERFTCKTRPLFKLNACINEIDKSTLPFFAIKNIIDCIVDRINECK